jgi:hypothetical protein
LCNESGLLEEDDLPLLKEYALDAALPRQALAIHGKNVVVRAKALEEWSYPSSEWP